MVWTGSCATGRMSRWVSSGKYLPSCLFWGSSHHYRGYLVRLRPIIRDFGVHNGVDAVRVGGGVAVLSCCGRCWIVSGGDSIRRHELGMSGQRIGSSFWFFPLSLCRWVRRCGTPCRYRPQLGLWVSDRSRGLWGDGLEPFFVFKRYVESVTPRASMEMPTMPFGQSCGDSGFLIAALISSWKYKDVS